MPSLKNRNVTIGSRRTSMRLEPLLWTLLERIAAREATPLNTIVRQFVQQHGRSGGKTSAVRTGIAVYFANAAAHVEQRVPQRTHTLYEIQASANVTPGRIRAERALASFQGRRTARIAAPGDRPVTFISPASRPMHVAGGMRGPV